MPLPIRKIDREDEQNSVDYSFLADYLEPKQASKRKVVAGNKDAALLYHIWDDGERLSDNFTVKIPHDISAHDLMRLKTMGFITGDLEKVSFTERGQIIIRTMVLSEQNNFEKRRIEKRYTEILASMDKRGKRGYRIAQTFAANNNNRLDLTSEKTDMPKDGKVPSLNQDTMLNTFGRTASDKQDEKKESNPTLMPNTLLNTFKGKKDE